MTGAEPPRTHRHLPAAIAAVAAIGLLTAGGLAACSDAPPSVSESHQNAGLIQRAWILVEATADDVVTTPSAAITVEFGSTNLRGETACGVYVSTYEVTNTGRVVITTPGVAPTDCPQADAATVETYFAALTGVVLWQVDTELDRLTLDGPKHQLVFEAAPSQVPSRGSTVDQALYEGDWSLVELSIDGRGYDMLPGVEITLRINDLWVTGNSGCNDYGAVLKSVGERSIALEGMSLTGRSCPGAYGVQKLEAAYTAVLPAVQRWQLDQSGNLVLSGEGTVLRFASATPEPGQTAEAVAQGL